MENRIAKLESIEFGEFDEYFPAERHAGQRREWNVARDQFDALIAELSELVEGVDKRQQEIEKILVAMKRIENEWGDYPRTREIAIILGLDWRDLPSI
ncbi:hypothetical protein L0244_06960 [bacterium]|nr:hypothetical protein [bacterium]